MSGRGKCFKGGEDFVGGRIKGFKRVRENIKGVKEKQGTEVIERKRSWMTQDLFVVSPVLHKGHQNSKLSLVKLYQRARKQTKLTL